LLAKVKFFYTVTSFELKILEILWILKIEFSSLEMFLVKVGKVF